MPTDSKPNRASFKYYLILIIVFTIWGSLYVVSKSVVNVLPTFTVSFIRFLIAFMTLSLMQPKIKHPFERRDYKTLLTVGILGYFISVGAQLVGTKLIGASIASLVNAMNPIAMSLFGYLLLKEHLTTGKIAGIGCAVIGSVIIFGSSKFLNSWGIVLSISAVIIWSYVSVSVRKGSQHLNPIQLTRFCIGIALVCYFPLFLVEVPIIEWTAITMQEIISLLYMGVVCTGLTYYLWNIALKHLDASSCSIFYPIQPIVATAIGAFFLHERISSGFIIGSLLIISGVLISLWRPKKLSI